MSSKTTNFNLHKIDLTDAPPDITVLNGNFDIIDTQLKKAIDGGGVKTHASTHGKSGSDPIYPQTIGALPSSIGEGRYIQLGCGDKTYVSFEWDSSVPNVPMASTYTFIATFNGDENTLESVLALPLNSTNRVYHYSRGRGEWDHLVNAEYVSQFMGVTTASLE